jgi:cytochrome c oxidase subunit IV
MTEHIAVSNRMNVIVFAVLLALLGATVGFAYVDLGPLNFPVAMGIATCKAILIVLFFMHVRYSSRLTWLFAGAALIWLAIMIGLTLNDYFARPLLGIEGK